MTTVPIPEHPTSCQGWINACAALQARATPLSRPAMRDADSRFRHVDRCSFCMIDLVDGVGVLTQAGEEHVATAVVIQSRRRRAT